MEYERDKILRTVVYHKTTTKSISKNTQTNYGKNIDHYPGLR